MSGQCYSCASAFGTFNKQHGCKNCGFAFCKKCLTKKAAIPQQNNAVLSVCGKCYNILTGKSPVSPVATFEPPDAYYKRLAALQQATKQVQPTQHAQHKPSKSATQGGTAKHRGLSKEDLAIAERLERLKEETKAAAKVPSQTEIEARLERLKQVESSAGATSDVDLAARLAMVRGQDPARANQPFVFVGERRTQQEQIDALLEEISDELEIDSRHGNTDPAVDIQDRLNKLKSGSSSTVPHSEMADDFRYSGNHHRNISGQAGMNDLNHPPGDNNGAGRPSEPSLADIERLMHEVATEMQIDAERAIEGLKKDKDLWNRVQRLKDAQRTSRETDNSNAVDDNAETGSLSDDEDDEKATKRIIQQLMEENCLDEVSGCAPPTASSSSSSKHRSGKAKSLKAVVKKDDAAAADDDELPWCCICNTDATLRCMGCDGDLYCQRCYREGHDRYERQEHRTVKYLAPTSTVK